MASNPYYVKGGGDYGRQLSGISNIVSGVREQRRGQAGKAALQEAYKTRDPEAINRVLVDHPELQEQVSKMDELGRMMKKDNILSVALGADQALNIEDAFERQAFLADRKNEVEARGGNASETDFLIGLPYEEQTQALEGLVEVGRNFAGYGGGARGAKSFARSSAVDQNIYEDDKGNLFKTTSVYDPNSDSSEIKTTPLGHTEAQSGNLKLSSKKGLTAEEDAAALALTSEASGKGRKLGEADAEASTADKVGAARAKIAYLTESAKLEAKDIGLLKSTKINRDKNIEKANRFLQGFTSGDRNSGSGRLAANYAPIGTWTNQGEFDEKFSAFAETAARAALKANGETRPTDADVEGMKRAMFGIGRDEDVNIELLGDFIAEQEALNRRLAQGSDLSRSNKAMSDQDRQALNWANSNPEDPRSQAIKNKLGN